MILSCNHIEKAYGVDVILKDVSFFINDNEKAAIVGMNGAGKSTILKIIMGEISKDGGEVVFAKDKTVGYLAQHEEADLSCSIYEAVLEARSDLLSMEKRLRQMEEQMATISQEELSDFMEQYHRLQDEFEEQGGYTFRGEITAVIRGLGFSDEEFGKTMQALSGGQKTRVGLARLLVSKPDLLLLDEPTNHLDIASIEWLEDFLKNYKGAVLIVSHDRYFLDRIVTKVIEIENRVSKVYKGSYSDYSRKKEEARAVYIKHYLEQQAEIKHQEKVIQTFRGFKTEAAIIKAKSREKALDRIERLDKPMELRQDMHLRLEPGIESGKDVLHAEDLSKSFGDKKLFSDVQLDIKKGERVAIIGANGTGKTTLLKILNGMLDSENGSFQYGTNVVPGYYDQEQQLLSEDKTLFDEIGDEYTDMTNTRIRTVLGAFLFTEDDVFKRIRDLSGGERGRMSLAKLMLSKANFLMLDEPTNHLDIVSKEILESALNDYTGTVLFVSHDRYFINRTATRILELKDGAFHNYLGNYDYYLEKSRQLTQELLSTNSVSEADNTKETEAQLDWQEQKRQAAEKRKLMNAIAKVEKEIEQLEQELALIEEKQADPSIATNSGKLNEWANKHFAVSEKLEPLYTKWEQLTNEV
ncbi:MAG: ABC-F family ATP-binding cassette domain-containing protein [Lachnospiraceae bacterium]|jgi:ATP-binding cassette subfamily F protein 3|nr:ABC-F family ATP-binding cassette domain-containing protein [Lachnospiraceae bacterium]